MQFFSVKISFGLFSKCPTSLYMLSVVPENLQSELVSLERRRALYSERLVWGGEGELEEGGDILLF